MNQNPDLDLLLYGVLLVGLGVLAHQLAPNFGPAPLLTCIAGGVSAVFWAVLGLQGFRRRIWPKVTLVLLTIALLVQAVGAWLEVKAGVDAAKSVAVILTLLMACGIVQLVNSIQEGKRKE
jgi:peptidoglycan/LPS O-acetylase OafA/YrhL